MARAPARSPAAPLATSGSHQIEHRLEVLGGYLVAYLNLDRVIKIIRNEDEPKPVLMRRSSSRTYRPTPSSTCGCAICASSRRWRSGRRTRSCAPSASRCEDLIGSEKEQWKKIADEIKELRAKFGPKTPLGKRRTSFAEAPEHDEAAIEEALVEREPITVVVSEKGWIRALRGTVTDLSGIVFKTDDGLKFAFPAETTSKCLVFATNGRFYTLDAAKLPGGRGHGEPIRLFIDIEQDADLVSVFRHQGGRKFLVASGRAAASWWRKTTAWPIPARASRCSTWRRPMRRAPSRSSKANSSPRSARTARC